MNATLVKKMWYQNIKKNVSVILTFYLFLN
jgi:hypothetical protein